VTPVPVPPVIGKVKLDAVTLVGVPNTNALAGPRVVTLTGVPAAPAAPKTHGVHTYWYVVPTFTVVSDQVYPFPDATNVELLANPVAFEPSLPTRT